MDAAWLNEGIIAYKYQLYRAYIGISNKGTLGPGYIQLSPDHGNRFKSPMTAIQDPKQKILKFVCVFYLPEIKVKHLREACENLSLPVISNVRISVNKPPFTYPEVRPGSAFRGSFHTSSLGMTGGFWKTRVRSWANESQ